MYALDRTGIARPEMMSDNGALSVSYMLLLLLLLLLQNYWFKWHIARYMLLGHFTKLQKYNVPVINVQLVNNSWNK